MAESTFRTGRTGQLHGRLWTSDAKTDRLITIVHGLGDHSGRYVELAQLLNESGWHVAAFDSLGHGLSPGRRGCVDSYDGALADIAQVRCDLADRFPQARQFLLGHSMGGNMALNFSMRSTEFAKCDVPLSGLVLCGPVILPRDSPPRPMIMAAWLTGYLLRWISIRKRVSGKQLSADENHIARIKNDPLMHSRISIYLATQILPQGRWALDHARELKLPTLIMFGESDTLIDTAACEHMAIRIGDNATVIKWPEMRHDLFQDVGREQVVAALLQWLDGCP